MATGLPVTVRAQLHRGNDDDVGFTDLGDTPMGDDREPPLGLDGAGFVAYDLWGKPSLLVV